MEHPTALLRALTSAVTQHKTTPPLSAIFTSPDTGALNRRHVDSDDFADFCSRADNEVFFDLWGAGESPASHSGLAGLSVRFRDPKLARRLNRFRAALFSLDGPDATTLVYLNGWDAGSLELMSKLRAGNSDEIHVDFCFPMPGLRHSRVTLTPEYQKQIDGPIWLPDYWPVDFREIAAEIEASRKRLSNSTPDPSFVWAIPIIPAAKAKSADTSDAASSAKAEPITPEELSTFRLMLDGPQKEAARSVIFAKLMAMASATTPDWTSSQLTAILKICMAMTAIDRGRILTVLSKKTGIPPSQMSGIYKQVELHASPVVDDRSYDAQEVAKNLKKRFKSLAKDKRPIVPMNDEHEVATLDHLLTELKRANEGDKEIGLAPGHKLFRFGGNAVRVAEDENGRFIIKGLTRAIVKDAVRKLVHVVNTLDQTSVTEALMPDWLADAVIAAEDLKLLPLDRFVRHPLFTKDGKLLLETGYDPGTKCFIDLTGLDLSGITLSRHPTEKEVAAALGELNKVFGDFPFASYLGDDADKGKAGSWAAFLTLLIMPLVREVYEGYTPIFAVDKPDAGTGASLLIDTIHRVWTGEAAPSADWPARGDDEDVLKKVTSMLIAGSASIYFDNVHGVIGGSVIPKLATGKHRDRKLGGNEMFEGDVRCPIIFAGNSLQFTDENVRRIIPIRLDAQMSDPTEGRAFQIEDLEAYLTENRSKVLAAAITLVRNWFAKGAKPSRAKVASFEPFAAMMGGILEANGIDGFLAGRGTFLASMKKEQSGEVGVFKALVDKYGLGREFSTQEAFDVLYEDVGGAFTQYEPRFDILSSNAKGTGDQKKVLGRKLGYLKGKVREITTKDGKKIEVRFESPREVDGKAVWWLVDNTKRKGR